MVSVKKILKTWVILKIAVFQNWVLADGYTVLDVRRRADKDGKLPATLQSYAISIRTSIDATMSFPWDTLESSYSGEIEVMEIVKYELPVLIPAAIGILGGLLVFIVTPFYLCCHCCGCCGTKLQLKHIQQQKRWCMYVTGLFVLCSICFIWFTAFGTYQSGMKFQKSPRIALDIVNGSLDDLPAFVTKFGSDLYMLVENELNETLNATRSRVQDLPRILAAPLTDIAGNAVTDVFTNVDTLQDGIDTITAIETEVNETVGNIITWSQSLEKGTNDVNANLTAIKTRCVTDGETFCHLLLEPSSNTPEFNTSELLDFSSSVRDLVSDVNSVNLTEIRSLGNESLTSLPETINNSSKTAVQGVLDELDKIPDNVLPELDSALEFTNMTRSTFGLDPTVESFKTMVDNYESITTPVVDKIVLPAISGVMSFIAALAFLGLLLGCIFSRRGSTMASRSSASHAGAVCLICNVVIAILPVVVFLLISSVLLVVGSNVSVICTPIQDLTFIEKLENGYLGLYSADSIADMLNINISIKYFFETCRSSGTIFTGLNLAERFNLSSYINSSSFVPKLGSDVYGSINETIRDMNVLDTGLLDNMTSSFTFTNITDDNSTQSIKEELRDLDLIEWAANLTKVASQIPKQSYVNSYLALAQILTNLEENEKTSLLQAMDEMDNITIRLQSLAEKLKNSSFTVSDELESLQQYIQDQATDSVFQTIDDFLDDAAKVPLDFIDALTNKMANDVGKCSLLWDIYDSVTASLCHYFLDTLNVFWLCLYVGGFATVILMISSCVIVKYFRKPSDTHGQRTYGNMSENAKLSGSNFQVQMEMYEIPRDNTSSKRKLPDWYYKVIKRKPKKRRRHCFTRCQSPQLIKLRLLSESLGNTYDSTKVNVDNCTNETATYCNEASLNELEICKNVNLCPAIEPLAQNLESVQVDVNDNDDCLFIEVCTEETKANQDQTVINRGQCLAEKVLSADNNIVEKSDDQFDNIFMEHIQDRSISAVDQPVEENESEFLGGLDEMSDPCLGQTSMSAVPTLNGFHREFKENHQAVLDFDKHKHTQNSELKQDESVVGVDCISVKEYIHKNEVTSRVTVSNSPVQNILESDCLNKDRDECTNTRKDHDVTFHYLEELNDNRIQCGLCKYKDNRIQNNLSEEHNDNVSVFSKLSDTSSLSHLSQARTEKHGICGDKIVINRVTFTDPLDKKAKSLCSQNEISVYWTKNFESNPSVSLCKAVKRVPEEVCAQNVKENALRNNQKKNAPNSLHEALTEFDVVYRNLGSEDKSSILPTDEDSICYTSKNQSKCNTSQNQSKCNTSQNQSTHLLAQHVTPNHKKFLNIQVKPYKDFYKDKDNLERLSKSNLHQNTFLALDTQKVPTAGYRGLMEIVKKDFCISENKQEASSVSLDSTSDVISGTSDQNNKVSSETQVHKFNKTDFSITCDVSKHSEALCTEKDSGCQPEMTLSLLAARAIRRSPVNKSDLKQPGFMTASFGNGQDKTTYL